MVIDGLEYPITESNFEHISSRVSGKYAYYSISENFNDKRNIRIYNHSTKEHYFLEQVWPKIGDTNLLFVDFPRDDAPMDSWYSHATQHANIRTWARNELSGELVRYRIIGIDEHNYCRVDDGYNTPSGVYHRSCFYTILKKFK